MPNKNNIDVNAQKLISELGIAHINRYLADRLEQRKQKRGEGPLSLWNKDAASV